MAIHQQSRRASDDRERCRACQTKKVPVYLLFGMLMIYLLLQTLIISFTSFRSERPTKLRLIGPPSRSSASAKDEDDRPLFVMHVGAPKTGTTAIQCTLGGALKKLLEEDNYYFIGKNHCLEPEGKAWAEPFMDYILFRTIADTAKLAADPDYKVQNAGAECVNKNCWGKFVQYLQILKEQHRNVIVSDEAISYAARNDFPWDLLKSALVGWRVNVIVTYRRYHEWYPSIYNQRYKATGIVNDLPGFNFVKWPRGVNAGGDIPRISKHLTEVLAGNKQWFSDPSAWDAIVVFKRHFNVSVLNYHDDGDIVTNFVCKMLPGAHKACHLRRNFGNKEDHFNPSVPLHYDMLSVWAHRINWLNNDISRETVRVAVRKHQEETLNLTANDLPLSCIDSDLKEQLFLISLEQDKHVFPERYSLKDGQAESKYRHIFEQYFLRNTLCSVAIFQVLTKGSEWHDFFISLNS